MDSRGAAPRPATVREMANVLLASRGETPAVTVGKNWASTFINRRDEIRTCFSRQYDYRRAENEDPKSLRWWFSTVKSIIDENGIQPEDIYNKSQPAVVNAIKDFETRKRRQGFIIVSFHSDSEQTLGKQWTKLVEEEGFTFHPTAPNTPEQNGPAERAGGVISSTSRSIRIAAHLPEDLWPYAVEHSVMLLNARPVKRLGWRTPYELIHGHKPNAGNLKVFGCKVYRRIPNIPKMAKLAPRAESGYLLGYAGWNIYYVWHPQRLGTRQNVVTRSRDVTFDETTVFDPLQPISRLESQLISSSKDLRLQEPDVRAHNLFEPPPLLDQPESDDEGDDIWPRVDREIFHPVDNDQPPSDQPHTPDPPLPTPEHTPAVECSAPDPSPSDSTHFRGQTMTQETGRRRDNRAPRAADISADFDAANIIPTGHRTRQPSSRRTAYNARIEDPTRLHGFHMAIHQALTMKPRPSIQDLPPEPNSWKEMLRMGDPFRQGFLTAAKAEYEALWRRGTWRKVPRPQHARVLPLKWVWRYKFDEDGTLDRFKARICVRGDLQIDWDDTYAATLSSRVIRTLFALATAYGYQINQRDIANAFLYSPLDDVVYVEFPPGMEEEGHCLLLNRALYGLKQSPNLWQREFSTSLKKIGLTQSTVERCLFFDDHLILFFFVDDIITLYKEDDKHHFDNLWDHLSALYENRNMGEARHFLGMRILRSSDSLYLSLDGYIEKITKRFHLDTGSRPPETPLPTGIKWERYAGQASKGTIHLYQQKVGSIIYVAIIIRADVAFAAAKLSLFMVNPSPEHMKWADRIIQYLYNTLFLAIRFCLKENSSVDFSDFFAAADAAYADNPDRKSSEGYVFKLYGGIIDWAAKKQKTVTTSTTEAELLALSSAAKQMLWFSRLFKTIDFHPDRHPILCDNAQTVRAMTGDETIQTRLRHIDIHGHWLRQEYHTGHLDVQWIPTGQMLADGLTKPLVVEKHRQFIHQLGLVDIGHLVHK